MARTRFEKARRLVSAGMIFGFVTLVLFNRAPLPPAYKEGMEACGLILLVLAFMGRIWAALYLSGQKSKVLTITGPYELTRNPLYVASFVGAIGIGLLSDSITLAVVVTAVVYTHYQMIIRAEEGRLRLLFGEPFDAYCKSVPRFFPRLRRLTVPTQISVNAKVFTHSMLDSSVLLGVFVIFQVVEAGAAMTHASMPTFWSLP